MWIGAFLSALAIAAASLAIGFLAGTTWGWATATAVLLLLGWHHLRNLSKLAEWVRSPPGTPVPDGSGIWDGIYAALHRRARAVLGERDQLAAALKRFAAATHAMPDGVIVIDPNHEIEWLNATAARHFDLDPVRDVGCLVTNLVRQPEFAAYLGAARYDEPLILHGPRVTGLTLSIQAVPFGAEQLLLISRDIAQLERLETMRRDFVANVSHELKTPLTVVGGFLETLSDNLSSMSAEDANHFLALAMEQSGRMQHLVDDLLTLSRLETGGQPPVDAEIAVDVLMAEVTREAQALSAGRHPIEVQAGPPSRLLGASSELRSAFSNLASNAIRYTPPGGRISLRWEVQADGSGVFSVEDAGIGIDARHVPRLTERFYRVDRGRSRETGGTGLGLAIVKHVLTRHDACLEVRSEPGRGSHFAARFAASRVISPPGLADAKLRS